MQAAAFAHLVEGSDAQGVRPDLLAPMRALIDQRVAAGHSDEDLAGPVELLRSPGPGGRA